MKQLDIDEANQTAVQRLIDAEPVIIDVLPAREAIPVLQKGVLLHAGPAISWEEMCGPMRGAAIGAVRYEGWAATDSDAEALLSGDGVQFHPNHSWNAVGPMAGITSPSMPVLAVENRAFGNTAFCTINEGLGKVLRFGAYDDRVIERLLWIQNTFAPALRKAVKQTDGIELRNITGRALSMGDEMHQRNVAATSLIFRELAPHLASASATSSGLEEVLAFIANNDQFYLNLAMAAAKATMDPVGHVTGSTVVWAMSRNGNEFGIRVSGTDDQWFTAQAPVAQGLYFPGYTAGDSSLDLGDSTIIETMGLGGFAMAASPAVAGFVGAGTFQDAINYTLEMGEITVGRNSNLTIPTLGFQGIPCGIDIRKVVETGITPVINTGIAHKKAGIGQVGAGIVRAPLSCFTQALQAIADRLTGPATGQE